MKYEIITIFPEFFDSVFSCGILSKAREKGLVDIKIRDLRNFAEGKHKVVDDKPYGGGEGMLFLPKPLGKAIGAAKEGDEKTVVLLTSAQGRPLDGKLVRELRDYEKIVIVCGRYEGVDERVCDMHIDMEVSIGDYIVSGGEYAAAVITDSVSRLVPGVVGNSASTEDESLSDSLLSHPQYTRPETYEGVSVPEALLSGNHGEIARWRREARIKNTLKKRPDILDRAALTKDETAALCEWRETAAPDYRAYVALLHYPVYNSRLEKVSSAFTNLDIHDIARACRTYGVRKFFPVSPVKGQRELAQRVIKHWTVGAGAGFNETRSEAMRLVEIKNSLEDVTAEIEKLEGKKPEIIATDARIVEKMTGYGEMREKIMEADRPWLLLLGTGWGIAREVLDSADHTLKPVRSYGNYNHLSVRCAAAAIMDRLFSCEF
ncbi:MAG: tRNA (guanosine(37)-N1)-methyltransferase TrmD [Candidatus Mycalebacterium zealandia]|nr:MAG: tRNA (guanosine(37)-N1)-methyltransferase TrmD [Candidatus Mycalebacterium zealandia]